MSEKHRKIRADIFFPVKEYREEGRAVHLNALIDSSCRQYKDLPALGTALKESISYQELHDRILLLAAMLRQAGVVHGDRIAILAENSPSWGTIYFALVRLGAICVPILPDAPEEDISHILKEMACTTVCTSRRLINKIAVQDLQIHHIITLDDHQDSTFPVELIAFSDFLDQARSRYSDALRTGKLQFPDPLPDQPASLMYTSGTSGFSKAVVLSHKNFCGNAYAVDEVVRLSSGAVFLSLLPISHAYEFTTGFLMPLIKGATIRYLDKAPTPSVLKKVCGREQPHVLLAVPLIMEKLYKKQVISVLERSKLLSCLCRVPLGRKLLYRKIGRKLHHFFGGRLEIMGLGGAALNPEVEQFLRDAEFPFLVGYGLSEAAPLISGGPEGDSSILVGSAGKPVPGVEVRINEPDPKTGIGEVLARGPNIMQGYWNNPQANRETLTEDGWLRTGDLGFMDVQGNLCVRGRSKSVIVLSNGENIYPEAVEQKLNSYPLVLDSLVIENDSSLEAWVYPDYDLFAEQVQEKEQEDQQNILITELEQIRKNVNTRLAPASRLTAVFVQQEPFVQTATHKIKRYLYTAEKLRSSSQDG